MYQANPATAAACAALALICVGGPCLASDKLEEMVVTSSRIEMPLRQVGTSISVITAQDITARGYNSLFEILRSQPGVAASNSGGAGQTTALRIRGEEGYRTRTFIDGIDISDTSGPQTSTRFEELLSTGIERVEILRGPQGLMYGADAGGVVNMTTQSGAEGFAGNASAEGGRYGSSQVAGNIRGGNTTLDYSLAAAKFATDGFNARSDDTALQDEDGYDNTTLNGRAGLNVSDTVRLELVARDTSSESEFDNCYGVSDFSRTDNCRNNFDQSAWRVVAQFQPNSFGHQLAYSAGDTRRTSYANDTVSFNTQGQVQKWSYLGNYSASDALRMVYGVDMQSESLDDGTFDRERDQQGYYLEYQGSFSQRFYVTAGTRYDDNDDFGSHTSYRASAAYLIPLAASELKLKGTFGTGFRAPSLYEVAYNEGAFAYPPAANVRLREEQSAGFDVGLAWYGANDVYLEANYFDQTINDTIYFDLLTYSGYLQDQGDSESRGVELVAELPLTRALQFSANYTYNHTEDVSGSIRVRRPEQLASLGLNWHSASERLMLGLFMRGAWAAQEIDGTALDDYQVLDLNASFELLNGLQLYGRVQNLLDEEYEEVRGYNTSGAAAYAGVRYSF